MEVFQYLDPYLVMQNYYQTRKNYDPAFSYSVWSDELGLKSSSTLRMMVNGKKRLSAGVAEKFIDRQFKSREEQNYFRLLLVYVHAPTPHEKESAWSALAKILSGRIEQEEALDYFTYISDLLGPKLVTMLSFDDQNWSEKKLAQALDASLDAIKASLSSLEKAGMVKGSVALSGERFWIATQRLIKVTDKLGDVVLTAYHNASLDEAKAAQSLSVESRRYKSLLLPLTEEEFVTMTNEINTFTKQLISKYQSNSYQKRRLFKLNLNYFPVSKELDTFSSDQDRE